MRGVLSLAVEVLVLLGAVVAVRAASGGEDADRVISWWISLGVVGLVYVVPAYLVLGRAVFDSWRDGETGPMPLTWVFVVSSATLIAFVWLPVRGAIGWVLRRGRVPSPPPPAPEGASDRGRSGFYRSGAGG